ncbi:MAG: hypothetical protein K2N30_04690, partial [Clostridia bacterium]|nr:hypothetical protein [Clostridia bacterium]
TINYLYCIKYDYELVKSWIEEFIDCIKQPELKVQAINCWSKKKNRFDKYGFDLSKIFQN